MKKQFFYFFSFLALFSLLFVSCNEDDDLVCKISVSSEGNGNVSISNYIGTSANVLIGNILEVVAVPDGGYILKGWYVGKSETPVSTKNHFTFVASEDLELVAKFSAINQLYVDLGLPSGIKWAICNVGASSPEEYGDYFAWGETEPKSSYDSSNSVTNGKSMGDIGGDAQYDAARANWGGSWRLPTETEFDELLDENNCTWTWTTQNGVNGYKVTSKKNGNSIFLPAAGYRGGTSLNYDGSYGYYWSSTPYEDYTDLAYYLYFYSDDRYTNWGNRGYGRSVRPVSE